MDHSSPAAVFVAKIDHGWAIMLTNGQELARFTGFAARQRADRYLRDELGVSSSLLSESGQGDTWWAALGRVLGF